MEQTEARLVLEDGSVYPGISFGHHSSSAGEVVFNTGMVGYPESLTDPSYRGQILALTYPLVGNYGVPERDPGDVSRPTAGGPFESSRIQVSGLVVSSYNHRFSHHTAASSLSEWLAESGVPAITGIDTRALTKRLRERGTMLGKLVIGDDVDLEDPNARNLVSEVSIPEPVTLGGDGGPRVVVVDCGVKNRITRSLLDRGFSVRVVPWDYDFTGEPHDGVFISNGPGNPKMCDATVQNIQKAMEAKIPVMGICLGNQLLALAAGADTYKMKYGHRSQNQPCIENGGGACQITSQNHGYAVDERALPPDWEVWFTNLNDGTVEGIRHARLPFFSVQFHPEAAPGPMDTSFLFDRFAEAVKGEI